MNVKESNHRMILTSIPWLSPSCLLRSFLCLFPNLSVYFRARCLARRFMKQQVTAAMMTMPTNKAEDTPITRGMRSRSATGEGAQRGTLKVLEAERVVNCAFISLAISKNNFLKSQKAAVLCLQASCFISNSKQLRKTMELCSSQCCFQATANFVNSILSLRTRQQYDYVNMLILWQAFTPNITKQNTFIGLLLQDATIFILN